MDEILLKLDLIYSKIGYILACLNSYNSLNLSKRINIINGKIYLIKKSLLHDKEYIDIRDVLEIRNDLNEIEKSLNNDIQVLLDGHKIACLLFEVSVEIKLLILKFNNKYEDMIEYLTLASKYLYDCGRIINIEVLCFENNIL